MTSRDILARYFSRRINDSTHTVSIPRAQIIDTTLTTIAQILQRSDMGLSQIIRHVHIISDASPIWSRIVCPKYFDRAAQPQGHLQDNGNQMCLGLMVLTDGSRGVSTTRIKVP